jgi:hypothetical protein
VRTILSSTTSLEQLTFGRMEASIPPPRSGFGTQGARLQAALELVQVFVSEVTLRPEPASPVLRSS